MDGGIRRTAAAVTEQAFPETMRVKRHSALELFRSGQEATPHRHGGPGAGRSQGSSNAFGTLRNASPMALRKGSGLVIHQSGVPRQIILKSYTCHASLCLHAYDGFELVDRS